MQRKLVEREMTIAGPRRRGSSATPRRRTITVNLSESPLGWLHAHGHLEDRLFDAGEKLRADYEIASIGPSVTMSWDIVRIPGTATCGLNPTERQIAARDRFDGAMMAAGKGLQDILWRVVCAGDALPVAEKTLEWPTRSGKLVLKLALDRVADYYRIN